MGFLSKLFSHKSVEEVADEIANTYAEEVQSDMLSDTAEQTAAEPVPMLEVTDTGEVDFTEPPENSEGESQPKDTPRSIRAERGAKAYHHIQGERCRACRYKPQI